LSLLIVFECLACLLIWWAGVATVLRNRPEHRDLDIVQHQRRADFLRNELEQRQLWWLMLSGLAMIVFVHWFMDKWEQRPWRAAMVWTITMILVLAVAVALTEHYGWAMKPIVG
jgi:cell division protein FtsW (lipid II flippase)